MVRSLKTALIFGGLANVGVLITLVLLFDPAKMSLGFAIFASILFVAGMTFAIVGLWPLVRNRRPKYEDMPRRCLHMTVMFLFAGDLFMLIGYFKAFIDTSWGL